MGKKGPAEVRDTAQMDEASQNAAVLLKTILHVRSTLHLLAEHLDSRPQVVRVVEAFDIGHVGMPMNEPTAAFIESYIDAELRNGHWVSCFVQLYWDTAQWTLEHSVRANRTDEQEYLIEFPDVQTRSLDVIIVALEQAGSEVASAIKALDLSTL
jgi:hypothetical protein